MAPQNYNTADWLEERPLLYKSAMFCMELHVANLVMDTATLTWTGRANRIAVSLLCSNGARVLHKYSKVEMSIRIQPLNSSALNDPNKFWSKKPGWWRPCSWAHNLRCRRSRSYHKVVATSTKHLLSWSPKHWTKWAKIWDKPEASTLRAPFPKPYTSYSSWTQNERKVPCLLYESALVRIQNSAEVCCSVELCRYAESFQALTRPLLPPLRVVSGPATVPRGGRYGSP